MNNIGKKSLKLHRQFKGKMEIKSKVKLETSADLCAAYTPGVAEVCRLISRDESAADIYTIKRNTVAVVTDGSAVLGLGNIGPLAALPVMEGKAILHKRFANIDAFPICLNTQDTEKIIETVKLIAPVFGAIHLEDISAPRCFEIEKRLRAELIIPVLHDDQHCTAVVVLAALINAMKCKTHLYELSRSISPSGGDAANATERQRGCSEYCNLSVPRMSRGAGSRFAGHSGHLPSRGESSAVLPEAAKIVINGAGSAGIAIAKLLIAYGFKNLILLDSQGTLWYGRADLSGEKQALAKITNKQKISGNLGTALKGADVFVGVSKARLMSENMVKLMNNHPIIFALANPIPEIMPEAAKKAGAFIVAAGRGDFPNQINNVLSFPGIFRGALDNKVKNITQKMLVNAAKNIAGLVKRPTPHKILPDCFDKRVAAAVAKAIKN